MNFFEYLYENTWIFFHPFQLFNKIEKGVNKRDKGKVILFSFLLSIFGNFSLLLSSPLIRPEKSGTFGIILFSIILSLIITYCFYFIFLSICSFFLSLFDKKVEYIKMVTLFLVSDFIYIILIPLAMILKPFTLLSDTLFELALIFLTIFNIALKIKAISQSSSTRYISSLGVYFLPFVLFISVVILGIFNFFISLIKLFV